MKYREIVKGRFLERPNRFVAYVELENQSDREKVHVKNTGRCEELLPKGATVYLEKAANPDRATAYDLVVVEKGERLINMDSQAPNEAVYEYLKEGKLFLDIVKIKREYTYQKSRFDFYIETEDKKILMEVKGVTLEDDGVVKFPDAPSERAVKHMEELIHAKKEGYEVYILFVVQMEGVKYFLPNKEKHLAFAETLQKASQAGVHILCRDCKITKDSMEIGKEVPIYLEERQAVAESLNPILLEFYDKNKRCLPWREEVSAYRVWVSEIMLQQTRVEAVKPYFTRFMETLPSNKSLAEASEEVILKLWEGLGYYNRVRNLQKAAQMIESEYAGVMPKEYDTLLTLPGIGSYTAGAVSSIAYQQVQPAVDGNVLRVMSRLFCDGRDILKQSVKQDWEQLLRSTMTKLRPGDFNQSLMEIGATICIPNGAPRCEICPLQTKCKALEAGTQLQYPFKEAKKKRVIEKRTVLILRNDKKIAISKRPDTGLLAGLYEFPSIEKSCTKKEVLAYLKDKDIKSLHIKKLSDEKHIFSHKEWHMTGYLVKLDELYEHLEVKDWIFVSLAEAQKTYTIPSAYSAYMRYLETIV